MLKRANRLSFTLILFLLTWLVPAGWAHAANEVFLSTDTAESEATYVIRFESGVKGNIDKIRITLPAGSNAANAALGRLFIGDKGFEGDDDHKKDIQLSLDGPDTLVIDLKDGRSVKAGTEIRVELFNLNNPVAGNHAIDVKTLRKNNSILEVIPAIVYSTFAGGGTGDITSVNTPAGSGLTGGAASGDVTLSLQSCPAGQVLKSLGASWGCAADNDTNSGGTITGVTAGTGLAGGGTTGNVTLNNTGVLSVTPGPGISITGTDGNFTITNTGDTNTDDDITSLVPGDGISITGSGNSRTIDVNTAQIQRRVTGTCAAGNAIRVVNQDGTVTCESVGSGGGGGGVTAVTASAPLVSTGGATPNISLPNVIIGATNTAIGVDALPGNTGSFNTASGVEALVNNTSGYVNTASGYEALYSNTDGYYNTASGVAALVSNTTGFNNTASGVLALQSNITGDSNTAIGTFADVASGGLTNATAIGANAIVNASNKIRLGDGTVTLVETAGDLRVGAGGTLGCVQDGDGSVIAGSCPSDARFKTNISPFASLLDRLVQLQPVHFYWKSEEYPERQFGSQRSFGLIAQEAEKLLPELVTEDSRGYKAVRYNLLPMMMLQAMIEQQDQVKELKTENADLKARLERLEGLVKERPYLAASTEAVQ